MKAADVRILWALLRGQRRSGTHAERLQAFYAPQAADYDRFRERLLQGRRELIDALPLEPGARVLELGAGTGRNVDFFGARLAQLARCDLVDLCPALLAHAHQRAARYPVLHVHQADAARYRPEQAADVVYLSYALSMMPDWQAVLDNAIASLAPGGTLGVVDFFVDPRRHGRLRSVFWRRWFAHDGVRLSGEPIDWLQRHLVVDSLTETRSRVPWTPGWQVPVYRLVGRRPAG